MPSGLSCASLILIEAKFNIEVSSVIVPLSEEPHKNLLANNYNH